MFINFRLITFWGQLTLLSKFLKLEARYQGKPFIIGSTSSTIDPKEMSNGNVCYQGKPLTIGIKE